MNGPGLAEFPEQPQPQEQAPAPQVGPTNSVRAWAQAEFAPPEERLEYLPPAGLDGKAMHPFKLIDRDAYLESVKGAGIAKLSHSAPIALVNLSDLVGIQGSINPERVGHHLADPYLYKQGAKAPGHGMLVDRPVVVRKNGLLLIHDGHHRLTAHHLRGLTTAKVRFIDLDAAALVPPVAP